MSDEHMTNSEWAGVQLAYAIVFVLIAALIGSSHKEKEQQPESPVAIEASAEAGR